MFTLDEINQIHDRLGKGATLPGYLKALKAIGVIKYDSFVADGHSAYYGRENQKVVSPAVHEIFLIHRKIKREAFLRHLDLHEQGKTSYIEMSKGLAESGIEKWSFDTNHMNITYYDLIGHGVFEEAIV